MNDVALNEGSVEPTYLYCGKSLQLRELPDSLLELRFDRQDLAINKLDSATISELAIATTVIRDSPATLGVLVTSAKAGFIVGADIFEFSSLFAGNAEDVAAFIGGQSAIFTAFADLPMPIVTAVNGLALGGGFEMALASDFRVASSQALVGLPEVSLGLFPGFGGCVRLPRLIGARQALDWIVSGKPHKADAALVAGAVDEVVPPDQLRASAVGMLHAAIEGGGWMATRRMRSGGIQSREGDDFTTIEAIAAKAAAHYPAAAAAVELVRKSMQLDRNAALGLESRTFGGLATSAAAKALVQLFINDQAMKKKAAAQTRLARKVSRAAVVGAGIMGGGIAYTSAARGVPVLMKDIAQAALDLGKAEAQKLLAKQVASGRMTVEEADRVAASIEPTLHYGGFEGVDIVVEAVVENMRVKQTVLAELEKQVLSATVLASNTSSLSISEMASALERPENLVGMHFFNPVPLMPLVEVIKGAKTSDVAAAMVSAYASAMGKTPVIVKDCPGFLVNRILTPYIVGFLKLIRDGASFESVDKVMEEFGWPMGPAYLLDVIGLDTGSHVFDIIVRGYPERMSLGFADALQRLKDHRRFGQKSGQGFYRYEYSDQGRPVKISSPEAHALIADVQPNGTSEFDPQEIVDRLMLPMVVEAAACMFEHVAETAAEIDTSLVLGLGFPRYLGGPLMYADQLGIGKVLSRCERLGILNESQGVTKHLRGMLTTQSRFHQRN